MPAPLCNTSVGLLYNPLNHAGGDLTLDNVTTLPNILRQYNPSLYGYAEGTTPVENFANLSNTRFNLGRLGAMSSDMLVQAQTLVAKMRGSGDVDFDNDWKIVTMFIGNIDFCLTSCEVRNLWIMHVTNALD